MCGRRFRLWHGCCYIDARRTIGPHCSIKASHSPGNGTQSYWPDVFSSLSKQGSRVTEGRKECTSVDAPIAYRIKAPWRSLLCVYGLSKFPNVYFPKHFSAQYFYLQLFQLLQPRSPWVGTLCRTLRDIEYTVARRELHIHIAIPVGVGRLPLTLLPI
jgi:hypothetical protein